MEPRIQYATAVDGVHVAFAVSGEGPTLISVPSPPDNHVQLEWEQPERRLAIEHLSAYRRLVRFDGRGTGLSDRAVTDFTIDARLADLEAVVEKLGVKTFALISGGHGNQLTVAYAVRHPEQVTHLIAVNPFVRGFDFMSPEQLSMWQHMLMVDFKMFTDVLSLQTYGFGREEAPRYAANYRASVEAHTASAIYREMLEVDLTDELPKVRCPVLVIQTSEIRMGSEQAVRTFASALPDARLVVVSGATVQGSTGEMIGRVGEFFDEDWPQPARTDEEPALAAPPALPEFRTVLFTDIENHTTMMQRLGDTEGREVLRAHERATRTALARFSGTEVKTMGDGFLASFRSVQRALDCAIALQREISAEAELPDDFRIRVGINAGEPIEEDGDLFGSAVITAARIVGLAQGGEILVSNVVRELVAGKGHLFSDRGLHVLRGFDEPMRLWELQWRSEP
jgi:class 3 adenylate cyclase/pimeloyl-ACP methyl ester carboxylesterase